MGRRLVAAVALLVVPAGLALAEPVDFTTGDEAAVAVAEQVLEPSLSEARAAGSAVSVWATRIDLNDDGLPEVVGQIDSVYLCGGMGPCLFILSNEGGDRYATAFMVPGVDFVEVLDSTSNGWRDLLINGQATWRWNGATYE